MKKLHQKQKAHAVLQARKGFRTHKPHHLLQVKELPDVWIAFRHELNSGRHQDIVDACKPLGTFEESMAKIAEMLDIALDGEYDAISLQGLAEVLLGALQRRMSGSIQPHSLDPRLIPAEIIEKSDGSITLEKALEQEGIVQQTVDPGEGPYTVCDSCNSSLDCCSARACKLGKPVTQLGNTMSDVKKTLDTLRRSMH